MPSLTLSLASPPAWILLSLASAMALGAYDVSKKIAVDRSPPLCVLFHGSVAGLALLLPCSLLAWCGVLSARSSFFVQPIPPLTHLLILLKALIVSASWVLSYFAIRRLPLSLAVPIRASAPLFTVLGALVLFGERLEWNHWLAIFLIFMGYWGLSRVGREEGVEFRTDGAVALLLVATLLGATSGLYDKFLLSRASIPPTTLQFWFCFYNVCLQLVLVLNFVQRKRLSKQELFSPSGLAVCVGVLLVVADQFYFRALSQEGALVAVVSMTRRSNVIMSFFVGGLLLREQRLAKKAKMLSLVMLGVLLLVL